MSSAFLYRFPSEAAASEAFGQLTRQLQEPVAEKGWHLSFWIQRINTGAPMPLRLFSPEDRHHELTQERAMREAWRMLIEARVEPPGMKLGNFIGAVETQALLYVLTHNALSPLYTEAAKIVLKALGVNAPDTVGQAITGALGALMDKLNAIEGLNIAEAILTTTIAGVRKALADGAITKAEIVSIVISDLQAAYGEATDGDSV